MDTDQSQPTAPTEPTPPEAAQQPVDSDNSAPATESSEAPELVSPPATQSDATPASEDSADSSETPPLPAPRAHRRFRPEIIFPGFLRRKLGKYAPLTATIVLVIVLGGSAAAAVWWVKTQSQPKPVEHFALAVTPFQVVDTSPLRDQKAVTDANKIIVTFSRPVDASKLNGDFFISPQVDGSYSQGATDKQAVFTPKTPLPEGTAVAIMIHGEFQSKDGTQLGADYSFGFTTATPGDQVLFQRQNLIETVGSAPANQEQTYTLSVGQQVDPNGDITIYKSDATTLLNSLIYADKTTNGVTLPAFVNQSIDTSNLETVKTVKGLKDGSTLKLTDPNGVYAIVATAGGKQVGHAWLVISDFGVILRQDDQQVVLAATNYGNSQPVTADVTLYSLNVSKHQLAQTTVNGSTSVDVPYSSKVDVAVATLNGEVAIIPVSNLMSMADLRVQHDLSTTQKIFGLTDKPTYGVGETVHYGGFVRTDNDAQYAVANGKNLPLYVAADAGGDHLADLSAQSAGTSGQISGNFTTTTDYVTGDASSQLLHIFATTPGGKSYADQPIASFTVTKDKATTNDVSVKFSKSDYLPNATITASVTGTQNGGAPLANTTVSADVYAKQYFENDPAANQNSADTLGTKLYDQPISVPLDANGHGSVNIDVSKLPAGASQVVTVQAGAKADANGTVAAGGASTIVHQGDGALDFGPTRTVVNSNGTVVARVYAKTLADKALANANIQYALTTHSHDTTTQKTIDKQVASGSAKADSSGFAEISQSIGSYASSTSMDLTAWTSDAQNNKIAAKAYYYIQNVGDNTVYSDLQLAGLDVSGAPKDATIGQTLNLTIDAPQDTHALVTLERGRIHKYQTVDFKQGKNSYSVPVTPDLAPSFSLAFSYFNNGQYMVDGVTFNVSPDDKQANVQISTDKPSYAADSLATIQLTAKDASGNPLQTGVIFGVVDAKMYRLYDQVVPNIFTYMYAPREITTNSSSSLTSIGSGGGKCGGGFGDQFDLVSPLGSTLLWNPTLSTNASGVASAQVKLPKGDWRIYAYSMNDQSVVGSADTTVTAN